eukprot:CAMPEP_0172440380 /NCGR_PEP_ID=MMETSP1065-20121228/1011_1 /TAXON_ID=265537 /ORGANISM="Amphiprora paludosa, Strain CCMP125" /LENGTH=437 /DNA_ID=CAMNT_0013189173 /DNA_START=107 /DNA_END=1417 /DNA_ORIENTATION=-
MVSTSSSLMKSFTTKPTAQKEEVESTGIARAFQRFEGGFPCYPGEPHLMDLSPAHEGFLFQRPMKVGSTTMVGVVLRLAHSRSPWLKDDKKRGRKCKNRAMHGSALSMEYDKRDRSKSFLFSLLRHPTKRIISEFFHFYVGTHNVEPTDKNFLSYVTMIKNQHKYVNDLRLKNYTEKISKLSLLNSFLEMNGFATEADYRRAANKNTENGRRLKWLRDEYMEYGTSEPNMTEVVRDIVNGYDFLAVTERMDESLVVMQMLLNLTTKEILYTHSRGSGTFSNGPRERPCIFIPRSFVTPGMQKYFESDEWQRVIRGDLLLYKAANESLDRTIEALGPKEFQRNLQALKQGLKLAEDNCKGGRVVTLCNEGGEAIPFVNNTCYIWGEACDHECINELDIAHLEIQSPPPVQQIAAMQLLQKEKAFLKRRGRTGGDALGG